MQAAHMRNSFKGASLREFFLALQLISMLSMHEHFFPNLHERILKYYRRSTSYVLICGYI